MSSLTPSCSMIYLSLQITEMDLHSKNRSKRMSEVAQSISRRPSSMKARPSIKKNSIMPKSTQRRFSFVLKEDIDALGEY